MQKRHLNPRQYFEELAKTSSKYFMPYIEQFRQITPATRILEIGCGCGGNLVPMATKGCQVTGLDITPDRISQAAELFAAGELPGCFMVMDILGEETLAEKFDVIIVHDVIEHLSDKQILFDRIGELLAPDGMVFMGFPAWQMPFGGHQQICRNRIAASMPFYHLLPKSIYKSVLRMAGEPSKNIEELLNIRRCRITVERFAKLARRNGYRIVNRKLYFINPHYEVKFGLRPRVLTPLIAGIPYVRNFFSTSCFFMLEQKEKSRD